MTEVKPTFSAGGICVADDVPRQVNQQQPARIVGRDVEVIEIHFLMAMVSPDAHKVMFVTDHIDQLELLEEGGDWIKALAPTSGRVSMEIHSGGALSKMKLTNVCATGPSLQ